MNHHHIAARAVGSELLRDIKPVPEAERLVRAAAAGDDAAWSVLVRRYSPLIRSVAHRHGLPATEVDDVVQVTWLNVFRHIRRVRDPARFGAWLHRIARHESLRLVNSRRRHVPVDTDELDRPATESSCPVESAERSAALTRALDQLTPRQRGLMQMLLTEDQTTYEEISITLGMPVGSIGPTRARCLERLRRDPALAGLDAHGSY